MYVAHSPKLTLHYVDTLLADAAFHGCYSCIGSMLVARHNTVLEISYYYLSIPFGARS